MRQAIVLVLALTGCATTDSLERAAREADRRAAVSAQYDAALTQRCVAYGFGPERIPDCKMQLDAQARAEAQQRRPQNCVVRTYTRPGGGYWATVNGAVEQRMECY